MEQDSEQAEEDWPWCGINAVVIIIAGLEVEIYDSGILRGEDESPDKTANDVRKVRREVAGRSMRTRMNKIGGVKLCYKGDLI